jgi:hypothetical protein
VRRFVIKLWQVKVVSAGGGLRLLAASRATSSMMPGRLAYCPVRRNARLGEQIAWCGTHPRTAHPLGDPVDERHLHVRLTTGTELIEAPVVHQDQQNVGSGTRGYHAWRDVPM